MKHQKKNFVEKIINFLLNTLIFLFGIILLISIYTSVQTKILGHNYADFFGYSMFEVQTGSMADTINAGDWIVIKLTPKVVLNDIVTYESDGEYITHRIIEVYNGAYITKGDANNSKDKPVSQKQIIGKVVSILPSFGFLRKILFNPAVLISLIITLFLFNLAIKKNKNNRTKVKDSKLDTDKKNYSFFEYITKKVRALFKKNRKHKNNKESKTINEKMYISEIEDDFEPYKDEDELDKTSAYRVISVNSSEIDNTFVEIAKTKFKNENKYWYIKIVADKVDAVLNILSKKASALVKRIGLFFVVLVKKTCLLIFLVFKQALIYIFLITKQVLIYIFLIIKGICIFFIRIVTSLYLFFFLTIKNIGMFFVNITKKISLFFDNVNEFREYKKSKLAGAEIKDIKIVTENNNMYDVEKEHSEECLEPSHTDESANVENKEEEPDDVLSEMFIPVNSSELGDTLLEIADNELKEANKNDKNAAKLEETAPKEESNVVEEDETLTNIDLELLKNIKESNKSKNIIDTAMIIKKEELNQLLNVLVGNNKVAIKDMLIDTYIDAKYYNYYSDKNIKSHSKNLISKIEKAIKEEALASEVLNSYHGKDNKSDGMIDLYATTLILIAKLEQAKESITDSKVKREFYKKEIAKYAENWDSKKIEHVIIEIIKIQKDYNATLNYFLEKLETNMFILNFNELKTKKDMYILDLQHNVEFSKVYSDYIIDKTYTEGIIAEDKMSILLTLLSVRLIKDMTLSDFNNKYIFYIPESLYTKEKKFERFLRMIDDKYAKDNAIILITFKDLLNHKKIIEKVRKMGYKFALMFDKETVIDGKNRGNIYIADYIFADKKDDNFKNIISSIPEELLNNVIYENIADKAGNLGVE